MRHTMNLNPGPFEKIASGKKTIELRLNDEKRRKIAVGDEIEFVCRESDRRILVTVAALHLFPDFAALYAALPLTACGYSEKELSLARPEDMEEYYTPEQQAKYGVLGIEVALGGLN